jgi:hypothetical protein
VAVEEQQVEMKIVLADTDTLLPGDEGEAAAQFEQHALDLAQDGALEVAFAVGTLEPQQVEQVGIAEDDVGAHLPVAKSADLGRDDVLRLLRQRGAFRNSRARRSSGAACARPPNARCGHISA